MDSNHRIGLLLNLLLGVLLVVGIGLTTYATSNVRSLQSSAAQPVVTTSTTSANTTLATLGCDPSKTSYTWNDKVISYGVRDHEVYVCDGFTQSISTILSVAGNKSIALQLVKPDGSVQTFRGSSGEASGSIPAPVAPGKWTFVVRNLGSSNLNTTLTVSAQ